MESKIVLTKIIFEKVTKHLLIFVGCGIKYLEISYKGFTHTNFFMFI